MRIEQGGAICGHEKLTVFGEMDVSGFFELDTLRLDGGDVRQQGGVSVLSFQMYIINGGSFLLTGGSLSVGPWFECRNSDFFYIGLDEVPANDKITISQNSGQLLISGITAGSRISLNDLRGWTISETVTESTQLKLFTGNSNQLLILHIWQNGQCIFRSLVFDSF